MHIDDDAPPPKRSTLVREQLGLLTTDDEGGGGNIVRQKETTQSRMPSCLPIHSWVLIHCMGCAMMEKKKRGQMIAHTAQQKA
eukprot:4721997-Ditylum_brightwellii.AAC.1